MLFTCLTIFLARIVDVSISTFRTLLMVRKKSFVIPILAFFEVFVWFIAARKALNTEVNSLLIPICYSLGYATGTFIGGYLSRLLMKDINSIEVITYRNNYKLIDALRNKGYAVSVIELKDNLEEDKDMLRIDVKSTKTNEVTKFIKKKDKDAFIVVKDTKYVYNGYIK